MFTELQRGCKRPTAHAITLLLLPHAPTQALPCDPLPTCLPAPLPPSSPPPLPPQVVSCVVSNEPYLAPAEIRGRLIQVGGVGLRQMDRPRHSSSAWTGPGSAPQAAGG